MDVVAEHYNISVSDIISKKKNKEIANPRQICMYLSRKYTDYSLQNIGKIMGNRDHTTVIHGHDKIGKMLETDEKDNYADKYVNKKIVIHIGKIGQKLSTAIHRQFTSNLNRMWKKIKGCPQCVKTPLFFCFFYINVLRWWVQFLDDDIKVAFKKVLLIIF